MRVALTAAALLVGGGLLGGCSPFRDDGAKGDIADWPPPAEVVARGRSVYQARCASCHGQRGEGEAGWTAQNADGTYPAPPHDSSGHTWHHADGVLFAIVHDGGAQFESGSFRSGMPAWGEILADDEIRAVIVYLKTLWGAEERAFQAEVSKEEPFPFTAP